jgi:hypothetical protein
VLPQAIFSHVHEIMHALALNIKADTISSTRRAGYVQDKVAAIFRSRMPTARIVRNAKWTLSAQQFETDLISVVGRTLVLAEAKSHCLAPQGMRGAPDRLRRHLDDLVLAPSRQSRRLA